MYVKGSANNDKVPLYLADMTDPDNPVGISGALNDLTINMAPIGGSPELVSVTEWDEVNFPGWYLADLTAAQWDHNELMVYGVYGGVQPNARLTAERISTLDAAETGGDWTDDERAQMRYRLQFDGVQQAPAISAGAQLESTAVNMRGTDLALLAASYTAPDNTQAAAVINHGDNVGLWGQVADVSALATIQATTDKLDTTLQPNGSGGYQFTAQALELGPSGGGGGEFWSVAEQNQIRYRLQLDGTQAAPITDAGAQLPATAVNMRGTDGANTVAPDNTQGAAVIAHGDTNWIGPTVSEIWTHANRTVTSAVNITTDGGAIGTAGGKILETSLVTALGTGAIQADSIVDGALNGKGDWATLANLAPLATSAEIAAMQIHGDANWATATSITVSGYAAGQSPTDAIVAAHLDHLLQVQTLANPGNNESILGSMIEYITNVPRYTDFALSQAPDTGGGGGTGTERATTIVPSVMIIPLSGQGPITYQIRFYVYDSSGLPANADQLPTVTAVTSTGGDRGGNFSGGVTNPETGSYIIDYVTTDAHQTEQITFEWLAEQAADSLRAVDTSIAQTQSQFEGAVDWTPDERAQIRMSLGVTGVKRATENGDLQLLPTLQEFYESYLYDNESPPVGSFGEWLQRYASMAQYDGIDSAWVFTIPALKNAPSVSGGDLTGPYSFAVTILDADTRNPIEDAKVRVEEVNGSQWRTLQTDASGAAVFTVEAVDYVVTASKSGYDSLLPQSVTITGSTAAIYNMDSIVLPPPDHPDAINAVYNLVQGDTLPDAAQNVFVRMILHPDGSGTGFESIWTQYASNDSGTVLIPVFPGATYELVVSDTVPAGCATPNMAQRFLVPTDAEDGWLINNGLY